MAKNVLDKIKRIFRRKEKGRVEKKVPKKTLRPRLRRIEEKPRPSEELKPRVKKRKVTPKPSSRRKILLERLYRLVFIMILEGMVFGILATLLVYIAISGLQESPIIVYLARATGLDNTSALIIFGVILALLTGILASDLAIRTQTGISFINVFLRRGRRRVAGVKPSIPIHAGRISLAGFSLVIPATGVLLIYLFPEAPEAQLVGSILTGGGIVISLWLLITSLRPPPPLPWHVSLAVELRAIKPEETGKLAELLRTAGATEAPSMLIARYLAMAVIVGFLLIPVGTLIGFSAYYQILPIDVVVAIILLFVIILVTVIYYPYIKFSQLRGERKRLVERDLPFFAIYASVLQSAGLYLDQALRRLIGNRILPGMEREGRIVEKEIRLGKDPLEAITELARHHPSRRFRDFIFGYTAVVRSGWDAMLYLTTRIKDYVNEIKFNWRVYSERAGSIGEMLIILFFMTTVLFILIAVVLPYGGIGDMMMFFNFLVIPIITVLMISVIDSMIPQPKIKDYYTVNIYFVIGAFLISIIILSALNIPSIYLGGVSFIAILLALGIDYYRQAKEIRDIEAALPEFLRDITEYRKIGFPLVRAFFMIKESGRTYNKTFDKLVNVVIAQLRAGIRLNRVKVPTRSWLGRFVFWLLGEIEDTGGGTPAILEEFTGLITDMLDSRENAKRQLRLYLALAYVTPVFLGVFVAIGVAINTMIKDVMAAVEQSMQELQTTGTGLTLRMPIQLRPADTALFHAKISLFVSSIALALTMGKAVDLTARNTLRVAIVAIVALVTIFYVDMIGQMFMEMLLG